MINSISPSHARLLTAVARAENTGRVLRVVDESVKRSAEQRQAREARRSEERLEEARRERARQAERLEAEDARRLGERHRIEAEAAVADGHRLRLLTQQAEERDTIRTRAAVDLYA